MTKKLLSVLTGVLFALFVITFAISVPILFRQFYYAQIKWLNLEEISGYTYSEIKEAYNLIMDYLIFGGEFSLGVFPYSEGGMEHFADCKPLFILELVILAVSSLGLITLWILKKTKVIKVSGKKISPYCVAAITILVLAAVLGIWGAIDFTGLLLTFHYMCFPGKTNWEFSYNSDPIIAVLPEQFWLNAAAVIAIIILTICVTVIIINIHKLRVNDCKTR